MSKGARKQPSPETIIAGLPKDYRSVARAALEAGWTVTKSGGGHAKLRSPDGQTTMPLPGSGKVALNLYKSITSTLRKAGLDV